MYELVHKVDGHPIPFDQEEIDEQWPEGDLYCSGGPPHVDEAHDNYKRVIASFGEWEVFRASFPFGDSSSVYFWNSSGGECFRFEDECGSWHHFVNLMAEIVEQEEDCRNADYSKSVMPSSAVVQHCENCGTSYDVG